MADCWADDQAEGHQTALLAWRRADIADLNRLARDRWDGLGRLRSDDVQVEGGRNYAVGDRLVALAPNPAAGIVTSETMTVLAVDERAVTVRTSQGHDVTLTGEGIDTDHLDYGYALTVHRAQGATYDRTHVLAAGGGRELAYVALSRARDGSDIYAAADDLAQAIDDIETDWGVERAQRWVTDTPAHRGRENLPMRAASVEPSYVEDLAGRQRAVQDRFEALQTDLEDLRAGTGGWEGTREGEAARSLIELRARLDEAHRTAVDPGAGRRDRHDARGAIPHLEASVGAAMHDWNRVGQPAVDQLESAIDDERRDSLALRIEAVTSRLEHMQDRAIDRTQEHNLGIGL
jgi:hypothetical protein